MRTIHVAPCGLLVGCACTNPSRPLPEDSSVRTEPSTPPEADTGVDAGSSTPEATRMRITVGSTMFSATFADSATARAFAAMLPLRLDMKDVNANEKFYELPSSLPTNASNPGAIQSGDLMLYGSNGLVLFYESFSTSSAYTRIGRLDDASGLAAALGAGNVTVSFAR